METTKDFLPTNLDEVKARGCEMCDFILVSGDAYVDHPSFGAAIIGRYLESLGYVVGILAQPRTGGEDNNKDFERLGRPRYAFLVTSGNLDSMVCRYTVNRKFRSVDLYSPGGAEGLRPDRSLIPYTAKIKQTYKGIPVILGGLEASLRRLTHYDYWSDKLRRSALIDTKADLLVYGMGEAPLKEIATRLASGEDIKQLTNIRGTVFRTGKEEALPEGITLPSYEEMSGEKAVFAKSRGVQFRNIAPLSAKILIEKTGSQWVVQNPPAFPLSIKEMDNVYELPFTRRSHPSYDKVGGVPSLKEVEFSITRNRGCYGGCSFCSLAFHQGKTVTTRSDDSIIREVKLLTHLPGFKGYIHDIGGPTANFSGPGCSKQEKGDWCTDKNCLAPEPCKALRIDHKPFLNLLRRARNVEGVKKVFVRSGIRFDYLIADTDSTFLEELCRHHISGQLKVAPEHVSERVLKVMNKPPRQAYEEFSRRFKEMNKKVGKEQFLIPYLISSHPGADLNAAIEVACFLKEGGFIPDQVQDFYPTPGTISTCIYFTGIDPRSGEKIYVPKSGEEKRMQRALLHFHKPENYALVLKALRQAGREDLIGRGPNALIAPPGSGRSGQSKKGRNDSFKKRRR